LPRQHAFQIDYGPHGFQSMLINIGDDWSVILPYARQYASLYLKDNGTFWNAYKLNNYIPLNYVIDTAGIVRYVSEGWDEDAIRRVVEQYLPDGIEHDVGVTRLLAPAGSPDSGAVIVPACSLYNFRGYAETYPVRMRIGADYDTSVTITNHGPGEQLYVEFPAWTAQARGQVAVTCSTELADDDMGSNNAKSTTLLVNVYDVAVRAILAPADSVDSGAAVAPAAEVENRGTLPDMAKVRFYIGDFYADSVNVALQPGRTDTAVLDIWTPALLGTFPVRCTSATVRADMVTGNNELSKSVMVLSTGIEEQPAGASRFALLGNSRNPSVASATIRYSLAAASPVDLRIFSATGKLVRTLHSGVEPAGLHQVVWNRTDDSGQPVGRGTYFCRMTAGSFRAVSKFTAIE
jgi:hypothetical protein